MICNVKFATLLSGFQKGSQLVIEKNKDAGEALKSKYSDLVEKHEQNKQEKLNNRERNIMELRFGFISGTEKTQKEVADMLRYFTKLHITFRKEDY